MTSHKFDQKLTPSPSQKLRCHLKITLHKFDSTLTPYPSVMLKCRFYSYNGGSSTEHWNIEHIGIPNVLNFNFPMVQKQDGHHLKTVHHWKTEQTPTIRVLNVFGIPVPT